MTNVKVSEMAQLLAADVSAANDYLPIIDASVADAAKNKRITVDDLGTALGVGSIDDGAVTAAKLDKSAITGQTEDTSPTTSDYILTYDASVDALKKVSFANAPTTSTPANASVTPAKIADSTWPRCKLRKSGNQTITPSGAANTVTWDTEDYDTDSMHDNVTNNSRITINTAGTYLVQVYTHWASNTTGIRLVAIRKNGASKREAWNGIPTVSDGLGRSMTTWIGRLSVGDYIEIEVIQNGAGSLNLTATDATQGDTYVAVEMLP